jgi:GNAT superfamily N-acetyltransferase
VDRLGSQELLIDEYDPVRDNEACLAIDRTSPQGRKFSLSFRRSAYDRRARNFAHHRLIVARLAGLLVGVAAVAFKDLVVLGEKCRAAFYFDLRVHPRYRNCGIGSRLSAEISRIGWTGSDIGYWYVVADNRAIRTFDRAKLAVPLSQYTYIVYPTYRPRSGDSGARAATVAEVHERLLATALPFDFYTDPLVEGDLSAHVASWLTADAGCSVWDNSSILAEVVESVPAGLRLARGLFESRLVRRFHHPHVPAPGEQLRSWYLFDVFGKEPAAVVDLLRFVAARAREAGVDYLYVPSVAGDEWAAAVRRDLPRPFAPEVRYLLYVGGRRVPKQELRRIYVDIRDL